MKKNRELEELYEELEELKGIFLSSFKTTWGILNRR